MSIELAWTLTASAGLLVAIWATLDAWGDIRAIAGLTNGRRVIAQGYLRAEIIRILIQADLLALGIGPLFDPRPVNASAFVASLMFVNLMLLVNSVLSAVDRLRVRKMLHPPPDR